MGKHMPEGAAAGCVLAHCLPPQPEGLTPRNWGTQWGFQRGKEQRKSARRALTVTPPLVVVPPLPRAQRGEGMVASLGWLRQGIHPRPSRTHSDTTMNGGVSFYVWPLARARWRDYTGEGKGEPPGWTPTAHLVGHPPSVAISNAVAVMTAAIASMIGAVFSTTTRHIGASLLREVFLLPTYLTSLPHSFGPTTFQVVTTGLAWESRYTV